MCQKSFAVRQRWMDNRGDIWIIQSFNLNPQDGYHMRAQRVRGGNGHHPYGYFDASGLFDDRGIQLERRLS